MLGHSVHFLRTDHVPIYHLTCVSNSSPPLQPPLARLPHGARVDVPSAARRGGLRGRDARLQRQEELHGAQGRALRLQPILQAATQGNQGQHDVRVTVREITYMHDLRGGQKFLNFPDITYRSLVTLSVQS